MTASTTILLVDDHPVLRAGIKALLQKDPLFEVVGEASNGRAALELLKQLKPDVIVMDVCMPELNGIDTARQALAAVPDARIIALSARSDERTTREMLSAGASAYVAKDAVFEELIAAIKSVMEGRIYLPAPMMSKLLSSPVAHDGGSIEFATRRLSSRERETLQLLAEGKATKEIARVLQVSVKTAETHRRNIMQKLELDNVADLTKYAIREGLTSVDS